MYKFRIKFEYDGKVCTMTTHAESEGEALEQYDLWADGLPDYAEFLDIEEVGEV